MKFFNYFILFPVFFTLPLESAQISTFYGPIEVEEPVLLELIESPAFQRLKDIHQYGVSYYTTHREEFSRYDHSLGVFAVLRRHGASLKEQVAGLLHDASHTAFSHVGDWIFGKEYQNIDYQDSIHAIFLRESGLEAILRKYNYTAEQMLPLQELFPALEQPLPNLCADRIDYNIQGAYYQGMITYSEAQEVFNELEFIDGKWLSTRPDLMKKLVQFTLKMTQECWGSGINHLQSRWLADAILRGIELDYITRDQIHFGTDQAIWNKLWASDDSYIQNKMRMIRDADQLFSLVEPSEADLIVKAKFRGIDPWINSNGQLHRLTNLDPELQAEYQQVKQKIAQGWAIRLNQAS
jgi:uncharacterized protein